MKMNNKLDRFLSKKGSDWKVESEYDRKNRKWLRYSSNIARRVLSIIKDNEELNQLSLANKIGVTPQYVSKLLKGEQNLSLETIGKLSDALNFELITFPDYKYSVVLNPSPVFLYYENNEFNVIDGNILSQRLLDERIEPTYHTYNTDNLPLSDQYINKMPMLEVFGLNS